MIKKVLFRQKKKILRTYRNYIFKLVHKGQDKIFVNSIQKAGTHFLTNALDNALVQKNLGRGVYDHELTRKWPLGSRENISTTQKVKKAINGFLPGEIFRGHVEYSDEISSYLKQHGIKSFLIIRNPLDVLISLANWWERHPEIEVQAFLTFKKIKDPVERVTFLMTGEYNGEQIVENLVTRYQKYLEWLDDNNCHVIRFEDLLENPEECFKEIKAFLNAPLHLGEFLEGLTPDKSKTFTYQRMKVHKTLTDDQLLKFKNIGGNYLLQRLNYSEV